MKKVYSGALKKAAKKILPDVLVGFVPETEFANKFIRPFIASFVQEASGCRRYVVVYPDDRRPTSFHVDLCWELAPSNRYIVNEQACTTDAQGLRVPRRDIAIGNVSLQYLCGYQISLGYRVPSAYDAIDKDSSAYLHQFPPSEIKRLILSKEYERLLGAWMLAADERDVARPIEETERAANDAIGTVARDLSSTGLPFLFQAEA